MAQYAVDQGDAAITEISSTALLWFRQDLRLADHAALWAANQLADEPGGRLLPVFVRDDAANAEDGGLGGAQAWWLHHGLKQLSAALAACGSRLVLRRGDAVAILAALAQGLGAREIHASRAHEPAARRQETRLTAALAEFGAKLVLHGGNTLFHPDAIRTKSGGIYGVFTPFARECRARLGADPTQPSLAPPIPAPTRLPPAPDTPSDRLEDWQLLPTRPDWAGGLRASWHPGEAAAQERLRQFRSQSCDTYAGQRDRPDLAGTSGLSPHLHWGEISAGAVWHATQSAPLGRGAMVFGNEILWREFSAYLLWHHPHLPDQPLRIPFMNMQWRDDAADLAAWQQGRTGIPMVDAGMRQLWQTGWMHNRVRMIAASFLVKHLLLPWQRGAAWFWDTLVDADLAANAASWQWVAGSGADAAPYFRVFNPVLQGRKFDPAGDYVRRYVPELARLADADIHAPWDAPDAALRNAGITLGQDYPRPVIDLAAGRARALAAFANISGASAVVAS